ncbi:MAG: hypothetical protein NKF70_10065 [Methanobacterium sp. ERen5]|nr:MAG: hypothetical protein NKF70_10065 [Methanobacterium sp. ERen5]
MGYETLIPSIPIIIGYLVTYTGYKKNLLKKRTHISIWNLAILLTFLVSGLGGFFLVILMDLGLSSPVNGQLLYWHVEFGITMIFVGLFHIHTYWNSTKKC